MSAGSPDRAARLVDSLAASAGAPPPPDGLRARRGRPPRARAVLLAGAAAALAAAGAFALMFAVRGRSGEPAAAGVVVERLRVNGRDVPTQVLDLPAAGALIVLPRAPSSSRLQPHPSAGIRVAAALPRAGGRRR